MFPNEKSQKVADFGNIPKTHPGDRHIICLSSTVCFP